jgi:YHS domain-containing protein
MSGNAVTANNPALEYNGAVFRFCCPGCDTRFATTPITFSASSFQHPNQCTASSFDEQRAGQQPWMSAAR